MIAVKPQEAAPFYEFGPYRVDTVKCVLLHEGQTLPLSLKAFEVLLVLIKHRGQVLEKDEILKEVWPDTVVEENNLARHISALRKTLDEHPNEHQYILTVPGRGYRFIASVRELDSESGRVGEEAFGRLGGRAADIEHQARSDQPGIHPEVDAAVRSDIKRSGLGLRVAVVVLGVALFVGVLVTSIIRHTRQADVPPPQRKLWQLTFDSGLEGEPTWSPDGRLIAYSSDRSGNFDVWVRPVGEGNEVRVTSSDSHDWQPDWAPDGNRLVFRSERDGGGLFVVPVLGGKESKISSFGYRPRWSPDAKQILFYSSILQNVIEIPKVYVVGLDGKPPHEVLGEFLTEFDSIRVAWHPDGQRISVWGNHRKQGWSLWTISLTGDAPVKSEFDTKVTAQLKESDASFTDFQWSSAGHALYFEGVSRSVRNLWKVEVDPQSLRWIDGPERLTTGTGLDTDMVLSRDGRKLAFTSRTERTRLWSLPFDASTGRVKGNGQPITANDKDALFPDISADGTRLAYVALRAGREEVWEKDLKHDGREKLLMTPDDSSSTLPRWSHDASRLAFRRRRPPSQERKQIERAIVLLSTDGGEEQMLTSVSTILEVPGDWSADGKWILASSERQSPGRQLLCLFPTAAAPHAEEQMRVVTSHPEDNLWQARFSPDNRWVSFCAAKAIAAGVSTIFVVPTTGGDWTRITEGKYFDDKPRWSPDGKILYFVSNRTGFFNVWGIRFDPATGRPTGEPFRVTDFESPGQRILSDPRTLEMAVSADRLVLPIMEDSGDIWILENVFSGED